MKEDDRSAVVFISASLMLLLPRLFISFLRMKRAAVRAEKDFYQTLRVGGVPKYEARKLAYEYTSVLSMTYWFRQNVRSAFADGNHKK